MFEDLLDFLGIVDQVYGTTVPPKAFQMLRAVRELGAGGDLGTLAKAIKTTPRHLSALATASDPVAVALRCDRAEVNDETLQRARLSVGQLVLGRLAERAFEEIYKVTMGTSELRLEDSRESRSDTDYRVYNGSGFPVFRINIKFHGSQFRQAQDLVGLQPEDCFALATYKINSAVQKHDREHLPYIFVVVGVPHLTREVVGATIPNALVHLVAMVSEGRRDLEDAVVAYLVDGPAHPDVKARIAQFYSQIENAHWTVCSARRANLLMREMLFERVFALRVKGFAQQYRRAEVDMHLSISNDLIPLRTFLETLRTVGIQQLMVYVERGTY